MRLYIFAMLLFTTSVQAAPYQSVKNQIQNTITNNKVVVVFFSRSSCGYCRYSSPIFYAAQRMFNAKATFLTIDTSQHEIQLKKDFGFSSVPTFMYFVNGKKVHSHGSENKTLAVAHVTQHLQRYC